MADIAPNDPCRCDSGRKYKKCCWLAHEGQPSPTPEALMRSRYSAYALGRVEHILRTTHPDSPHREEHAGRWRADVRAFCESASFDKLEILSADERDDKGMVDFRAHLSGNGKSTVMAERSLFLKVGGQWLYHSGVRK